MDKGFSFGDFLAASRAARQAGAGVKAYLLQKPPYLTEKEAIGDVLQSVHDVRPHADVISLNPCTVQKGTEVERLWRHGAYRPPYLWSVVLALSKAETGVILRPGRRGHPRGPHNCASCDSDLVRGIRDYSLSGDRSLLEALLAIDCGCKKEWEFVLEDERPWCMPLTGSTSPDWTSSCLARSGRKVPASETTPMTCWVPRSMSFVTDVGLMSTQTVFTDDGRQFPTAIEWRRVAIMRTIPHPLRWRRISSWAAITSVMTSGRGPSSLIDPARTKGIFLFTHSNMIPPVMTPFSTASLMDPAGSPR